jgi:hypothetical protein
LHDKNTKSKSINFHHENEMHENIFALEFGGTFLLEWETTAVLYQFRQMWLDFIQFKIVVQ